LVGVAVEIGEIGGVAIGVACMVSHAGSKGTPECDSVHAGNREIPSHKHIKRGSFSGCDCMLNPVLNPLWYLSADGEWMEMVVG